MVNLEHLEARGLRAYELGRVRMAAKVGLLLLPVTLVCLLESEGRQACACTAVLLLFAAIWLRWRDRAGVDGVADGLVAGSAPLVFGLLLGTFAPECASADLVSACTAVSILVGGAAGVIVAVREAARPSRPSSWLTAAIITTLAASMGCIRLGIASVLGVALGVVVGRATSVRTVGSRGPS
jgi:hypothetical protein